MIPFILLVAAAIFATLAAFWFPDRAASWPSPRPHFGWIALAFYFWAQVILASPWHTR